jgi:hypothetical protein
MNLWRFKKIFGLMEDQVRSFRCRLMRNFLCIRDQAMLFGLWYLRWPVMDWSFGWDDKGWINNLDKKDLFGNFLLRKRETIRSIILNRISDSKVFPRKGVGLNWLIILYSGKISWTSRSVCSCFFGSLSNSISCNQSLSMQFENNNNKTPILVLRPLC